MVRNRKWNFMGVMLALCLVMGADATIQAAAEDRAEEQTVIEEQLETNLTESEIQSGERTATIMVIDITGNELTYYEVEDEAEDETADNEVAEEGLTESATETDELQGSGVQSSPSDKMSQKSEEMTFPEGIPQGSEGGMTPPDKIPQGSEDGMTPPDKTLQKSEDGMFSEGMTQKDSSAEKQNTKTVYLPVPVVVHTDTDEKRTFSILEAGDRLQVTIVTDEDGNETITEIWMLGDGDKT